MNAESREIVLSEPAHTHAHTACCTLVLPAALNASAEFIARRVVRQGPGRAIVMAINADGYLELRETLIAGIESAPPQDRARPEGVSEQGRLCLSSLMGADLIVGERSGDRRRLFEYDATPPLHLPALVHSMTARDLLLVACRDEQECLFHAISLAPLARVVIHAADEDARLRAQLETLFATRASDATGADAVPAMQLQQPDRECDDPR